MGNGIQSSPDAKSKHAKSIRNLAEYMSSDKCSKIVLMLGAGLYSNLARLNLPHPEAVFEISFFRRNPVPFYTLASELYPGSFRPTLTHSFIKLLFTHDLLHMCFTQNIDTLERRAGVPPDKIVEAHGSFATQRCIDCQSPYPDELIREYVLGPRADGEQPRIPRCQRKSCRGLVKPDIVFFGEGLPDRFTERITDVTDADLLIIMGTSLTVHPFASLAQMADRRECRRVLINLEQVGDLGRRPGDIVLLGECDAIVGELCKELGWTEELEKEWALTEGSVEVTGYSRNEVHVDGKEVKVKEVEAKETKPQKLEKNEQDKLEQGKNEDLESEVEKITEAINKQLDLQNVPEPVAGNEPVRAPGQEYPDNRQDMPRNQEVDERG